MNTQINDARKIFSAFPKEYTIAPLWYWNDDLREEEIVRQLKLMKEQHVYQAMTFPMAGLNQPYPSQPFFERIAFMVKEAKKLGMKIWFYDEYCWPSGLAGGIINEKYPEFMQPNCRCFKYPLPAEASRNFKRPLPDGNIIFAKAFRKSDSKKIDLRNYVYDNSICWHAPAGEWEIMLFSIYKISHTLDTVTAARWSNNAPGFVDCMNKKAMSKYLELVYDEYYRAIPEEFGKTVLGFFFDEPSFNFDPHRVNSPRNTLKFSTRSKEAIDQAYLKSLELNDDPAIYGFCSSIPWTRDMLLIFKDRCGYALQNKLNSLVSRNEKDRKICYDFYKLVSDLFAENYAGKLGRWCQKHKVSLTGHWGEGPSDGDYYKQLRPMQVPGIDLLGDMSSVNLLLTLPRKAASAAKMLGRKRIMAETYGCTNWNFNLADKIAVADLLNIMGINLITPIDYEYSFRSFRKHTGNPPGFFQSPNWKYQNYFSDHTARLSQIVSLGKSKVKTAIFHSAEERLSQALVHVDKCHEANDNETKILKLLHRSQIEADILFDTALRENAKLIKGKIIGKDVIYDTVILPSMHIISELDLELLGKFVHGGGTLVIMYHIPLISPEGKNLRPVWKNLFSLDLREGEITKMTQKVYGKGKILQTQDPAEGIIQVSKDRVWKGEKITPFDGTDSVMKFDWNYPHWLSVDLQKKTEISGITVSLEDIETQTEYQVQTSDNGKTWRKQAAVINSGGKQKSGYVFKGGSITTTLKNVKTRYLRLLITKGGHRFFGIRKIEISYSDKTGKKCWSPSFYRPDLMAKLIPQAQPDLTFYENKSLAVDLITNVRQIENKTVHSIINNTDKERSFTGKLTEPKSVEVWNLDTGKTNLLRLDENNEFQVSFAPYETMVFVQSKEKIRKPFISLSRRRKKVTTVKGPWKFKTARENAFPLAVCNLQMADPAYPETWYPAINGRIPEQVRLVPFILFKCDFQVNYLNGDEKILFEKNIHANFVVNGRHIAEKALPNRYLDEFGMSVPIGNFLKKGKNTVSGRYFPELFERNTQGSMYHHTKLQPTLDAFIIGNFSVKENRIVEPNYALTGKAWQKQGYPYYSGTGIYNVTIPKTENGPLWLEADVRGAALELKISGKTVAIIVKHPYLFDLTPFLKKSKGTLQMEVMVTNTVGSLLSGQKIGCLIGGDYEYESGLQSLKLVRPT